MVEIFHFGTQMMYKMNHRMKSLIEKIICQQLIVHTFKMFGGDFNINLYKYKI